MGAGPDGAALKKRIVKQHDAPAAGDWHLRKFRNASDSVNENNAILVYRMVLKRPCATNAWLVSFELEAGMTSQQTSSISSHTGSLHYPAIVTGAARAYPWSNKASQFWCAA